MKPLDFEFFLHEIYHNAFDREHFAWDDRWPQGRRQLDDMVIRVAQLADRFEVKAHLIQSAFHFWLSIFPSRLAQFWEIVSQFSLRFFQPDDVGGRPLAARWSECLYENVSVVSGCGGWVGG